MKIKYYAHTSDHFARLRGKTVTLIRGDITRELGVVRVEFKGDSPILFFAGYSNPEDAAADLSGAEIWVPRELGDPLAKDEFYLSDLIGLQIFYQNEMVGVVSSYFEAAHIIVEMRASGKEPIYLPFIEEYFGKPDFKQQSVELLRGDLIE